MSGVMPGTAASAVALCELRAVIRMLSEEDGRPSGRTALAMVGSRMRDSVVEKMALTIAAV
jgi:hypothetical protein